MLSFETDASTAIQSSLQQQRPLAMLICRDDEDSRTWVQARLSESNPGYNAIRQALEDRVVLLKVLEDTTNYRMLLQLFPQFGSVQFPTLLVVYGGRIVDLIPRDTTPEQFTERIEGLRGKLANVADAPVGTTGPIEGSSGSSHPQPQPQASTPTPFPDTETTAHDNKPKKKQRPAADDPRSRASSVSSYHRTLRRASRADELERERILRLVRMDRREKLREQRLQSGEEQTTPARENLHNEQLQAEQQYVLQVKLLDGKAIHPRFARDQQLAAVRALLLAQYPSYRDVPFYFYRSVDRVTYRDEDEQRTLADLMLNRATLLVKPLDPVEVRRAEESRADGSADAAGTFGWIRNTVSWLLWGTPAQPQQQPYTLHSEPAYHDEAPQAGDSAAESTRENFNMYGRKELIEENRHEGSSQDRSGSAKKPDEDKRPQLAEHRNSNGTK